MDFHFRRNVLGRMSVARPAPPPPPSATRHISKGDIYRLCRRAGVVKISAKFYNEARKQLHHFISKVLSNAIEYKEHCRRKTVSKKDVKEALKREGMTIYE